MTYLCSKVREDTPDMVKVPSVEFDYKASIEEAIKIGYLP